MNSSRSPLNENEIRQAVRVVRRDAGLDPSAWFETISLDESERHAGQRRLTSYAWLFEISPKRTPENWR
jgi:Cu2+-containing amine oxidase